MNLQIKPAPVRRSVTVDVAPARAFEIFTRDIGRWWPATHHIGAAPYRTAVIEPREGGRWYEIGEDGSECDWGRVLAWEPPGRLLLAWQIDGRYRFDPSLVTEVEVRFVPDGAKATRVELEHRNLDRLGDAAAAIRETFDSPSGWAGLLALYADAVASDAA